MRQRTSHCLLLVAFLLGQVGCAALSPPSSYRELKARMQAAPSDPRYATAREHLKSADAALVDRDKSAVERFSHLGILETRIADAQRLYMELIQAREHEVEMQHELKQDVAHWRSKVDTALAEQARFQMRQHIEAVIDSETREAAAAEELQSHMGDTGDDALQTARRRVAQELIAMARVRTGIVAMLVASNAVMAEQAQALDGSVALMEQALNDDDIASVYRYGERNLALFTACIDGAWILAEKDFSESMAQLHAVLQKSFGENIVREDVGYALVLPLKSADKDTGLNDASLDVLELAAVALQNEKKLAVMVVVSGNGFPVRSKKRIDTLVKGIRDHLTGLVNGIGDQPAENQSGLGRFSVVNFVDERPLRALTGVGIRGALVFFPIP